MFWTFLLAVALATTFVKLGAASVMIKVLSIALLASLVAIAVLVALLLRNRLSAQRAPIQIPFIGNR